MKTTTLYIALFSWFTLNSNKILRFENEFIPLRHLLYVEKETKWSNIGKSEENSDYTYQTVERVVWTVTGNHM